MATVYDIVDGSGKIRASYEAISPDDAIEQYLIEAPRRVTDVEAVPTEQEAA